jgi:hypothetical protein
LVDLFTLDDIDVWEDRGQLFPSSAMTHLYSKSLPPPHNAAVRAWGSLATEAVTAGERLELNLDPTRFLRALPLCGAVTGCEAGFPRPCFSALEDRWAGRPALAWCLARLPHSRLNGLELLEGSSQSRRRTWAV